MPEEAKTLKVMLAKLISTYPRSPSESAFPHMPTFIFLFKDILWERLQEPTDLCYPGIAAPHWIICSVDDPELDRPVEKNLTFHPHKLGG